MRLLGPALLAALAASQAEAQPPAERQRIAAWIAELADDARRDHAAAELIALGPVAVPQLVAALDAFPPFDQADLEPPIPVVQVHALDVLGRIGPGAAPAIPVLIAALDHAPWYVRGNFAQAIGALGPFASDDEVAAACAALGGLGSADTWVVEIGDAGRHRITRAHAVLHHASWLCRVARSNRDASTAEMIRLLDRDPPNLLVRELAAMRLRHGGDEARAAIPTLRALLAEHYPDNPTPETLALRESASHVNPHYLPVVASALLALSPDDAALVWTHRLVDGRRGERLRAALALGHLGAGAQGAVRYLITAARCDEPRVAAEAITALGMIGVPAAHAVPLFEELVRHDDAQIRTRAQAALRQVRGS